MPHRDVRQPLVREIPCSGPSSLSSRGQARFTEHARVQTLDGSGIIRGFGTHFEGPPSAGRLGTNARMTRTATPG